ncbi:MAG: hypothetical protein WDN69_27590 [Aliidongia sp.]
MADPGLAPDHPFLAVLPVGRSGVVHGPAGVSVALRETVAQIAVTARRGQDAALTEQFRARYGLVAPTGPRHIVAGPTALVGIGSGRWIFLQDMEDSTALAARLAAELGASAAVADLSDSRCILRLWGAAAAGCVRERLADRSPSQPIRSRRCGGERDRAHHGAALAARRAALLRDCRPAQLDRQLCRVAKRQRR